MGMLAQCVYRSCMQCSVFGAAVGVSLGCLGGRGIPESAAGIVTFAQLRPHGEGQGDLKAVRIGEASHPGPPGPGTPVGGERRFRSLSRSGRRRARSTPVDAGPRGVEDVRLGVGALNFDEHMSSDDVPVVPSTRPQVFCLGTPPRRLHQQQQRLLQQPRQQQQKLQHSRCFCPVPGGLAADPLRGAGRTKPRCATT
jgi:hypothetical protein